MPKTAVKNGGEKNRQRRLEGGLRTADRECSRTRRIDGRSQTRRIESAAELGCYYLVGVAFLASEGVGDGFEDDLDIEEETPVFYIPDVFLDTFFHHP